jgi:tRNA(adenine34) deaminase
MTLLLEKQKELVQATMLLAEEAAAEGNLPFAALLIDKSGNVIIAEKNTVNTTKNAAAHAEINILFEASRKLNNNDLSDYALVSNAASCPMCITATIKAKITEYYYGADNEGAMVPNISMDKVLEATPFGVEVHGGILAEQCADQIKQLAKR